MTGRRKMTKKNTAMSRSSSSSAVATDTATYEMVIRSCKPRRFLNPSSRRLRSAGCLALSLLFTMLLFLEVRLLAITSACSRRRRSPDGVWCVEQAPSADSTHQTPFFVRRGHASTRRESEDAEHQTRSDEKNLLLSQYITLLVGAPTHCPPDSVPRTPAKG